MRRLALGILLFLVAGEASAQTCPTQGSSPALTAGGSVFGRIAAQWNAYFGAKADANNGVLCNPTIIGGSVPGSSFTLGSGLSNQLGARNTGTQTVVNSGVLYSQLWPVPKTASYVVNSDSGTTSDHGALLIAAGAGITFTLPNPSALTRGVTYQFGSDGTNGYTLATAGGTALFYGCVGGGGATLAAALATDVQVVDDGTGYKCGGLSGGMSTSAANAVLPTARTNLGLGTTSDVAFGSLTLAPTAGSLTQALNLTNSAAGTASDPFNYLNKLYVSSDDADVGANRLVGFGIEHHCCGSSAKGERFSLWSQLIVDGTGNAAAGVAQSYVGLHGLTRAEVPAPNASSSITGGNVIAQMLAPATGWAQVSGLEVDVTVLAGANPLTKTAFPIVLGTNDAVQGSTVDAALYLLSTSTSAIGWKNILLIDQQAPHNKTISTDGCVVCLRGSMTMATGLDLSGATISGNFLKGPSDFSVSGAGYLSLKRDQSIQFSTSGITRNLARFLNASDTITFGDTDNGGSAPVTWNFAGGKVSISSTTATTSGSTGSLVTAGGLGVGGGIFATGYVASIFNSNGTYPASQAVGSWAIGNNFSAGSNEVTLWNTVNGAGGLDFRQKTGASASTQLASMTTTAVTVPLTTSSTSSSTGALVTAGGFGVGGNTFLGGQITGTVNLAGAYPASQATTSWNISGNFSAGNSEVNFWNVKDGTGGFDFRQKTGASASTQLASMTTTAVTVPLATASTTPSTGALVVTGGLGVGGAVNVGGTTNSVGAYYNNSKMIVSPTAPTIASGGCTTGSAQSISASNGSAAFEITLGGATCGSTITLTMPAAATNWVCDAHNITTPASNVLDMTGAASTTAVVLTNFVRTTGVAGNFTGAEKLAVKCSPY